MNSGIKTGQIVGNGIKFPFRYFTPGAYDPRLEPSNFQAVRKVSPIFPTSAFSFIDNFFGDQVRRFVVRPATTVLEIIKKPEKKVKIKVGRSLEDVDRMNTVVKEGKEEKAWNVNSDVFEIIPAVPV